jgi:hypothetical protein
MYRQEIKLKRAQSKVKCEKNIIKMIVICKKAKNYKMSGYVQINI